MVQEENSKFTGGFVEQNNDYIWIQQCFQDPNAPNHVFSPFDDERKDNEPLYDDYTSQSENGEEGYNVLDTFECKVNCQNTTFLENMSPIFSGSQMQSLVDSQGRIHIKIEELQIDESP